MTAPQFFLVAPTTATADLIIACAAAAVAAGPCASIVVTPAIGADAVAKLQALNLAVLLQDAEPRDVHYLKADGLHLSNNDTLAEARAALTKESLGAFAATSRHNAMEAAEAGADYVAFAQNAQHSGEPLIKWWQDFFPLPVVAFDPVDAESLAHLLPQSPDFIRPSDAMWQDAPSATRIISEMAAKL
jgi:thiamine-phosphate pyrophosphorylase